MHEPGSTLGGFHLEEVIGRGGMGVVHRASQAGLGRDVALKIVSPELTDDVRFRERFEKEARLAASVEHPNVLPIYEAGDADGVYYVAMRLVSGADLRLLVRQSGPLPPVRAVGIVAQVAAALDAAHRRGLVHRDVKPSNVLISDVDGRDHAYLTDFGLARLAEGDATLTGVGQWAGTVDFAAPEQIRGDRGDARTDVYALGGVLFWTLTGQVPFRRDTQEARLWAHLHEPPPLPSAIVPGIPPALDAVVTRAMAKAPEDRFATARALAQAALAAVADVAPRAPLARAGDGDGEDLTIDAAEAPTRAATAIHAAPVGASRSGAAASASGSGAAASGGGEPGVRSRRRRPALALVAGLVLASAGVAGLVAVGGGDGSVADDRPAPVGSVRPFDFDGDRRQDLTIGLPDAPPTTGAAQPTGAVVVMRRSEAGALEQVYVARAAAERAPGQLGRALASADFDGDGYADLAAGAGPRTGPGVVVVRYGSRGGLARGRGETLEGPTEAVGYGTSLVAGDVDGDGYGDLLVGAPGDDARPDEDYGSGTVRIHFGGADGLAGGRTRTLARPRRTDALFGAALALADVDGDGDLDLAEAAPGARRTAEFGAVPGHASYCPGGPDGPDACRAMGGGGPSGPTALATGDVTGDGRADVVHGFAVARDAEQVRRRAGVLRIWRGTRQGPAGEAIRITQDSPGVRGHDQPGDGFGSAVAVADLDRDGYADLVTGAPDENEGTGRVTITYGGRSGYSDKGGVIVFDQGTGGASRPVPGDRFGAALSLLDTDGDNRLDLAATQPGNAGGAGAVVVVRGENGSFPADSILVDLKAFQPGGVIRLGRRSAS